jgi:hypothetical protein
MRRSLPRPTNRGSDGTRGARRRQCCFARKGTTRGQSQDSPRSVLFPIHGVTGRRFDEALIELCRPHALDRLHADSPPRAGSSSTSTRLSGFARPIPASPLTGVVPGFPKPRMANRSDGGAWASCEPCAECLRHSHAASVAIAGCEDSTRLQPALWRWGRELRIKLPAESAGSSSSSTESGFHSVRLTPEWPRATLEPRRGPSCSPLALIRCRTPETGDRSVHSSWHSARGSAPWFSGA